MRPKPLHLITVALAGAAALTLAACGGGSSSGSYGGAAQGPTTTAAAAASGSTATLSADPGGALAFNTTSLTAKAGTVTITMTDPSGSGVPHAIAVEGNGVDEDGATAQPGGTSSVTVTLPAGTYTFYCPVPGHEAAGMKGTLTVS